MPSLIARMQRPVVRQIGKRLAAAETPEGMRRFIDRVGVTMAPCRGVTRSPARLGRLDSLQVLPKHGADSKRSVLFFHGGGYVFGSPKMYQHLAGRLAKAADAVVHIPRYRLAPEHPYPSAIEDGLEAYRAMLDLYGAEHLTVAGDSAGGNMTMAVLIAARNEDLPLPGCILLLSPWTDLTATSESWTANAESELLILPTSIRRATQWYRGDIAADDPRISPQFDDLAGLPPTLIQVSDEEILYSDSTALTAALRSAGVDVDLQVSPGMWHVWQLQAPIVREARESIAAAGRFLREHTG